MNLQGRLLPFTIILFSCAALAASSVYAQSSWKERREGWQDRKFSPGSYKFHINHQDRSRYYLVYVPQSYDGNSPIPVVFNFHGGGGSAEGHQKTSRMNVKADSAGFLAVYPAGTRRDGNPRRWLNRFWNVGAGPAGSYYADSDPISKVDDVGFVYRLLDDLQSRFNIDRKRIYATGLSNGGILTHLLACRLNHSIAAIAPVAAPYWSYPKECSATEGSVSVMLFHGTADLCAPYQGGVSQCSSRKGIDRNFLSARETANIWKNRNGCIEPAKVTYQQGEVTCETYETCAGGSEVTLCTIDGGGHTWPGGRAYSLPGLDIGETTSDIDANEAMWEFFIKHSR